MRVFCWVFLLSIAVISPLFRDIYPFSIYPMFSDNTSEYLLLRVTDMDGRELPSVSYGLFKPQLFSRDQRYGYDLGPSYFDHHSEIQRDQVQQYLRENFPANEYPVKVNYRIRGFSSATGQVQDLEGPIEFVVDVGEPDSSERPPVPRINVVLERNSSSESEDAIQ